MTEPSVAEVLVRVAVKAMRDEVFTLHPMGWMLKTSDPEAPGQPVFHPDWMHQRVEAAVCAVLT